MLKQKYNSKIQTYWDKLIKNIFYYILFHLIKITQFIITKIIYLSVVPIFKISIVKELY